MNKERFFGKNIGKLGYGNMRLPKADGKVDYVTIHKMVDTFMEAGYSYFDTCYTYEASERALGEALVPRYPRDSYELTTKLTMIPVNSVDDMQKQFDESRRRLGLDYVDFYFLHSLNAHYIEKAERLDAWGFVQRLKEKGDAKHIGFSFHDTPELLDDTLTKHPETELVLLQINYLDWENPEVQSRRLYETARKHNVPVSIMEPCKGGWLASELSESGKFLKAANPEASVASWAFRFLADLEGVVAILTGMGALSEVEDNVETFRDLKPLSEEERKLVQKAVEILSVDPSIPCTDCLYCVKQCPNGVAIAHSLKHYNGYLLYKDLGALKHMHYMMGMSGAKPKNCTKCGACEKVCPQHLKISDYMAIIAELVGEEIYS